MGFTGAGGEVLLGAGEHAVGTVLDDGGKAGALPRGINANLPVFWTAHLCFFAGVPRIFL